ncbi:MAG: hypothetical protein LBC41_06100, partial [Clostridiales bacterium]|nr:hypothetical protein [Clostridiales bacterium]
ALLAVGDKVLVGFVADIAFCLRHAVASPQKASKCLHFCFLFFCFFIYIYILARPSAWLFSQEYVFGEREKNRFFTRFTQVRLNPLQKNQRMLQSR